jgi:segregation and condensation protein A
MSAPTLAGERFEGPLDLLLALVRKNQVDITEIPIAEITRQYLDYLETAEFQDLEMGAEFAYMASTLIEIKSRQLLPPDPEIAAREPDPRQELIRQLLEHDQVRQAAEFLQQQLEVAGASWTHGSMAEFLQPAAEDAEPVAASGSMNLLELLQLARKAVETARTHDLLQLDTPQVTIEEMIAWLRDRLASLPPQERLSVEPLFYELTDPARRVALFLAILELTKTGVLRLDQQDSFTPIFIDGHKSHLCRNVEQDGDCLIGG